MEKNNTILPKPEPTEKAGIKKQGIVARFFAWIARGAEKAAKDGISCTR